MKKTVFRLALASAAVFAQRSVADVVLDVHGPGCVANDPIRLSDYVALLDAFETIVGKVRVSDSYETDFRRNLPAGGWRGLEAAPTLKDRIDDVRAFVSTHPVYSSAGAALLVNIIACTELCARQDVEVQSVVSGLKSTLVRVSRGELR